MNVVPAATYVHHMCTWGLRSPEEGIWLSATGVLDSCEPPCECWEVNPGRGQEQQVLLNRAISSAPEISSILESRSFLYFIMEKNSNI